MSKKLRRNHAPAFKAKVALETLKGEQTIIEIAQRYQIHPNQITQAEAGMTVFEFIEAWCNPYRRHSGPDYSSLWSMKNTMQSTEVCQARAKIKLFCRR